MIVSDLSLPLLPGLATSLLRFLFRVNIACFPDFSIPVTIFLLTFPTTLLRLPCS